MRIQTTRFGNVDITDEDIVVFEEGLLGFSGLHKFVLLDDPNDEIFIWLQSCEEPGIAFPVLEPELYLDSYQVELSRLDLEALSLSEAQGYRVFTIITIPNDPTQMTANLKAPVIVNLKGRKARQCVLQNNTLAIREPIFSSLQQRVVQNPASSIKSRVKEDGVAIPLPNKESEPGPSAEA